jgi:type VI secretion system secreted protein Hcp
MEVDVPIYMKFGSIPGDVTTEGYKNWIELNSFQFGVSRGVSSGAGGGSRESSAPSISEIVVTKYFDAASPKLYQDSVAGTFDTKVEIKMNTTTKNKTETFLTYELTDCGVSSYSQSSGGDAPVESLSLNFIKVMVTPTPLDKSGQIKKGDVVTYDLLEMKAS